MVIKLDEGTYRGQYHCDKTEIGNAVNKPVVGDERGTFIVHVDREGVPFPEPTFQKEYTHDDLDEVETNKLKLEDSARIVDIRNKNTTKSLIMKINDKIVTLEPFAMNSDLSSVPNEYRWSGAFNSLFDEIEFVVETGAEIKFKLEVYA